MGAIAAKTQLTSYCLGLKVNRQISAAPRIHHITARFVVITEGLIKIKLSWDMALCRLLNCHRSFGNQTSSILGT